MDLECIAILTKANDNLACRTKTTPFILPSPLESFIRSAILPFRELVLDETGYYQCGKDNLYIQITSSHLYIVKAKEALKPGNLHLLFTQVAAAEQKSTLKQLLLHPEKYCQTPIDHTLA